MEAILTVAGLVAVCYAVVLFFKKKLRPAVQVLLLVGAAFSALNAIYGSAVSEGARFGQAWMSWIFFFGFILLAIKVGDWLKSDDNDAATGTSNVQ